MRDLEIEQFQFKAQDLPSNVCKRPRHVLSENRRVKDAVEALRDNDAARLGIILYDGHASLRDDFAVSREEIDTLVEIAE